jgi:acetyl esterase/lipase
MDQAALDAAYNNSAAVVDSASIIADWDRRSAELAAAYPQHLDVRHGPRERNRLDFFAAHGNSAPVLVFIHGGYWQMRAKETFRFLAAGPLAHGISVANVAYTLAPDATLREIVAEIDAALTYVQANATRFGADRERIFVSGWSAGGHLTAQALSHTAVRGGVAISGIYDLEPIRLSFLNQKLGLGEQDVRTLSPLYHIATSSNPLAIAFGTSELPELQRQSRDYFEARAQASVPSTLLELRGHNHFTILEELASPQGALTQIVRDLTEGLARMTTC